MNIVISCGSSRSCSTGICWGSYLAELGFEDGDGFEEGLGRWGWMMMMMMTVMMMIRGVMGLRVLGLGVLGAELVTTVGEVALGVEAAGSFLSEVSA